MITLSDLRNISSHSANLFFQGGPQGASGMQGMPPGAVGPGGGPNQQGGGSFFGGNGPPMGAPSGGSMGST